MENLKKYATDIQQKPLKNPNNENDDDFSNLLQQAAHIKQYQLSQDRKFFDSLPDFYKDGLYNYSKLENIYNQSFFLKKCSYDAIKFQAIKYLKQESYDEALNEFTKSICLFKYIKSSNKDWKNGGGIKDEELTYINDKGKNIVEEYEINNMLKSSLLNISLCNFYLKNWVEVRSACDEVIKIDNKCVKAYYRKAKTYIDNPASLMDDYVEAKKILEEAKSIDKNNKEINDTLDNLTKYIDKEKNEEKKYYKSFYRKVNEEYEKSIKNQEENKNKFINKNDNTGVAQIRMLNLIIELCHTQLELCERHGKKKEAKNLRNIINKGKKYRDDLQNLMEIDFDNPNEKLKSFALKENLDLNDLQVQKYFLQLKKKIIDEINEFHEKNLDLMKNQNENNKKLLNNIKKINKEKGFKSESEEENEMFMKKEIENIDDKDFKKIKNSILKNNKNKKQPVWRKYTTSKFEFLHNKIFWLSFLFLSCIAGYRIVTNYIKQEYWEND